MVIPSPQRVPAPVRHSAWLLDLAFAVITLIGVVTGYMAAEIPESPWEGAIPLALFLGAVLLLRRRWPMTVLLLSVAAIFVFHSASMMPGSWIWPASLAYFSAATTTRVRWVALIGAGTLVYEAVQLRWIVERNVPRYLIHVLGEGLLLAALISAGLLYAAAMRWRERLRESEGRTRAVEERLQLSREVHDIVAHTLAIVGVQLNVAADALEEDPAEAAAALRVAKDVRNRAMADLRSLIGVLRDDPGSPAPQPDLAALGDLAESARATGLRVTLDERGDPLNVPAAPAVAVYRIVQEALTNTVKHANASGAEVSVGYGPRSVTVEVTDDGQGCARIAEGQGLTGMRGRVGALNGTLSVESTPGGFSVRAEIPVAGSLA